jgi:predicted DNA-binding transcriptional regulator AlpA
MEIVIFTQLKELGIPFTRVWVMKLVEEGKFPQPIQLGANRLGWVKAEIEAWKAARPRGGLPSRTTKAAA